MRISTRLGPVLVIGEVLFDVFPDERRLGGAPFNFAWHLHHLGIPVLFVSRVGDDDAGREILDFARSAGFPTEGIQIDRDHPTGEVQVIMEEGGGHRFHILPDRAYDHLELTPWLLRYLGRGVPYIYFGSLIQRSPVSAAMVESVYRQARTSSTFVVDLNLRAPFYAREVIVRSLARADLLKLNDVELLEVKRVLDWSETGRDLVTRIFHEFHPGNLCLTLGERGSLWFAAGETTPWRYAGLPIDGFVDSVGAGDAFSAMMLFGFMVNWPRLTILEHAAAFAGRVCGLPGALPTDRAFYESNRIE